jgi:hypothetical protein
MRTRLGSAIVVSAALLAYSSRARASGWDFFVQAEGDSQLNTPTTQFGLDVSALSPTPTPPDAGYSGNITTPDGLSTGTFSPFSASSTQEFFSSFPSFLSSSAATGQYSLTANDTSTSQYNFSLNFSNISPSSIPQITITSPPANEDTSNPTPTFTWTDSGDFTTLALQFFNNALTVNYIESLSLNQTSWTVPADLPDGTYQISVQASMTQSIPLSATLLSGPNIGLPDSVNFFYDAGATEAITVVPEPTSFALIAIVPFLLHRRRRRD